MHAIEIVTFCGTVVGSFAYQWLAARLKLPAILFFLFAGILVGPVLGWLDPDALLGELLTPFVSNQENGDSPEGTVPYRLNQANLIV